MTLPPPSPPSSAPGAQSGGESHPAESGSLPRLIAVVGPTASGKSALALELALRLGGEVVNTDSMQVYRRFDLGTAKPTPAERRRVPHHLIDVAEPDGAYSAGRYVAEARAVIAGIAGRGQAPILCGGTGLYFRALFSGLADIPTVPPDIRAAVERQIAGEGLAACHAELQRVDPAAARAIHPNDPARIARALEVYRATGTPLSRFREARPFESVGGMVFSLGLAVEPAELWRRIEARVSAMMARGWIDEVATLLADGIAPEAKPMRAIGYRQIAAWLARGGGPETRTELERAIVIRTRQYAKRQRTWFRKHPDIFWRPQERMGEIFDRAAEFLR